MIPPNPNDLQPNFGPGAHGPGRGGASTAAPAGGVFLPVPAAGTDRPVPPSALTATLTPQGLLKALRRRWVRALFLGLIFAPVVGAGIYLLRPTSNYTGRTILQVSPEPSFVLFKDNNVAEQHMFHRTQIALIRSRLVLNTALKDPKVAELKIVKEQIEPIQWLESQIKAGYELGPDFLTISMSGDNDQEIVAIVNAVNQAYLREVVQKEHNKRLQRIDNLREIANKYQDKLQTKKRILRDLAQAARIGDAKNLLLQQTIALQQQGTAQSELNQLRSRTRNEKAELEMLLAQEKSLTVAPIPPSTIDEAVDRDEEVLVYKKIIADTRDEMEKMRRLLTDEAFKKMTVDQQNRIKKAEADMDACKRAIRPRVAQQARERMLAETRNKINALEARLATSNHLEKALLEDINRYSRMVQDITTSSVDMESIRDEIKQIEMIAQRAASEAETMEVERHTPPRVRPLDDEVVIIKADQKSKNIMMAGMAALGALGAVFFAVSWWEWRARRIDTVDEVVHGLGMAVFGALPAWRRSSRGLIGSRGARETHWQSLFTESVDTTRTLLLHTARRDSLRVVLVTSAVSGEGKTSLSTHLATSLARANRRTLLLDCDLRKPAAHRLFDLPLAPGFSEVVRGEVGLAEAIQPTTVSGLWLLSAGQVDDRVLQALAQDDVPRLLELLKEQFEFIIVDSSPVLPVADSLLVAQNVDAVLFSILRDVSRIPMVYTAYQRLAALGVRMLGAVISGANEEAQGYSSTRYGYRYGYGQASPRQGDDNAAAGGELTDQDVPPVVPS
jgi:capsular exopolysaccharide synthesis family protein